MLPLDDLTVLDLSRILSGPYCSMYLGDFGA
ncbi:MAG: CoA transferase, partial [Polyangia bacterium]